MKTSEILQKAKALIDTPDKWIKGDFKEGKCYCMAGALAVAEDENPWGYDFKNQASEALRDAIERKDSKHRDIALFNDSNLTEHHHVMEVFDDAIAAELAKEQA